MKVLVIGGTGTVGSGATLGLVARGAETRVLTRDPSKGGIEGAEYVRGDLQDPASVRAAAEGVDAAFLLTPLHPNEAELGVNAARALGDAGVGKIVQMSIHHAEDLPEAPHFAAKVAIQRAIEETGAPFTVIAPSSFFQNDLRLRQPIMEHGIYPLPIGNSGVNRVDTRDVSEAAVRALLDVDAEGRTYPVVGPDALTGDSSAEIWSERLGRHVRYMGDDLDAWGTMVSAAMPDWLVEDLKAMYGFFQRENAPMAAGEDEIQLTRDVLGHDPRSYEAFAVETLGDWEPTATP